MFKLYEYCISKRYIIAILKLLLFYFGDDYIILLTDVDFLFLFKYIRSKKAFKVRLFDEFFNDIWLKVVELSMGKYNKNMPYAHLILLKNVYRPVIKYILFRTTRAWLNLIGVNLLDSICTAAAMYIFFEYIVPQIIDTDQIIDELVRFFDNFR